MKRVVVCFLFIFGISLNARASTEKGRDFGVFLGGALTRSFSTVDQAGVNAKLDGWGNYGEFGIDLPFSENFCFSPSVEIGESQLVNKYRSNTYLDRTKISSKAVRALFYYKGAELGGSYRMIDVDLQTVSISSGASSASVDGAGSSFFIGYSFTYRNVLRAGIEAESTQFQVENFNLKDFSVGLRLHLLLGGILGEN